MLVKSQLLILEFPHIRASSDASIYRRLSKIKHHCSCLIPIWGRPNILKPIFWLVKSVKSLTCFCSYVNIIYIFVEFYRFTMSVFSVYTHLEGQVQKALERKCGFRHFDTNITVTTTAEMVSPERGCSGMAFRECPIHLVCQTRHRGSPWPGHLILLSRRRP